MFSSPLRRELMRGRCGVNVLGLAKDVFRAHRSKTYFRELVKWTSPIFLISLLCLLIASPWISTGSSAPVTSIAPTSRVADGSIAPNTIRQISLITKDLVFDPVGQRIYASLPSSAPNG